jgi:hypothetical protein
MEEVMAGERQTSNLMIEESMARIDKHEAICELRYDAINARLKRIEQILMGSVAFIITMLVTIVLKIG